MLTVLLVLLLASAAGWPELPRDRDYERRVPSTDASLAVEEGAVLRRREKVGLRPPPVVRGFLGDTSTTIRPSDASGAVGLEHVVTCTNAGFTIHDRNGTLLSRITHQRFWSGSENGEYYFDPRIVYDAAAGRWVTVALHVADASHEPRELVIAASTTADPAGPWSRYTIHHPQIDFTRLALTRGTVLLATRHNGGESTVLFSIDKSELYGGARELTPRRIEGLPVDAVPVHAPESGVEYVVSTTATAILVNRTDRLAQPWREFSFEETSTAEIAPTAPQAETAQRLDTGYDDAYAAVLRGTTMYTTRTMVFGTGAASRTAVLWAAFDPESAAGMHYGMADDSTGNTFYAYPSLAANGKGEMLVAFSSFPRAGFPSAHYVFVNATGGASAPAAVKAGESPILDTDRWGDYTTTVVDPRNDRGFLTLQLYATSEHGWGAWWAEISPGTKRRRAVRK
jgi:hypothetical protein